MNKIIYVMLFGLICIYGLRYKQFQAVQCGPSPGMAVSVNLEMPEPVLDTSLSLVEIMQRYRNYQKAHSGGSILTLGLTEGNWNSQYKIQIIERTKTMGGEKCLAVDKVDVTLNLQQTIYLADSMTQDKCHIKTLMDHEMLHATVNRDITKESVGKLEKALQEGIQGFEKFQGWGPYPSAQSDAKRKTLEEYIKLAFNHTLDEMQDKGNRLNSAIDSVQEYDHISRKCSW